MVRLPAWNPRELSSASYSGIPVVWWINSVTVTVDAHAGNSVRYFDSGSSSESLPDPASSRAALAVNCLDTEPMSKTVSVVIASPVAMSAAPRSPVQTTLPAEPTAAEQPGPPALMASSSTR